MQSPGPARSLEHLRFIDALRGWAFLGVLLVHCGAWSDAERIRQWTQGGQYGVQLFFLLSAVTLFRSLALRGGEERHPWRNYAIRRILRIAPLFWFGIWLYFFLNGSGPQPTAPAGLSAWHYLLTATFLHGWGLTSFNSVVPGGWSIGIEMTFYLCLPWMFRRIRNVRTALAGTFVTLVAGVVLSRLVGLGLERAWPEEERPLVASFVTHWFPLQLPVFLLGAAVYHAWQDARISRALAVSRIWPALLVAMSLYGIFTLGTADGGDWLPMNLLYALAFAPLILGLATRPYPLFVNRLTCLLGKLSFSCYLLHFAALQVMDGWVGSERLAKVVPPGADWTRFLLLTTGTLALTILFSTATYWLIERPGIRLGNELIRRGECPAARGPSTRQGECR